MLRSTLLRALPYVRLVLAAGVLALACGCSGGGSRVAAWDPDSIPDAYRQPSGALMWPGAARAWYVGPAGHLYNGDWEVRIRPYVSGQAASPPRRISAEERWRPVLRWTRRSGMVRWTFEAAAFPDAADRHAGLVACRRGSDALDERAAMVREAIQQFAIARQMAKTPQELANVIELNGQLAQIYGLPWEALAGYRQAQLAHPGDPALARRAEQFQALMAYPTYEAPTPPEELAEIGR